jgi:cytochrome c-type biogenesis protein CcmH/NrfG
MNDESIPSKVAGTQWKPMHAYAMAAVCLVVGLALGYLFRGSEPASAPRVQATGNATPASPAGSGTQGMPTLEQMKQMADKQVEPLLEKLKADPDNPTLLNQVGTVYKATHQFKQASGYYEKALKADPKNVAARTDLASCLYYEGDIDAALSQLQQALKYDPKDANSLFNLGMIKWQAKKDAGGAVTAWQQLLESNPQLADEKKIEVQKLIAQAKRHSGLNN